MKFLCQHLSTSPVQVSFGTVHASFIGFKDVRSQVHANRGLPSFFSSRCTTLKITYCVTVAVFVRRWPGFSVHPRSTKRISLSTSSPDSSACWWWRCRSTIYGALAILMPYSEMPLRFGESSFETKLLICCCLADRGVVPKQCCRPGLQHWSCRSWRSKRFDVKDGWICR